MASDWTPGSQAFPLRGVVQRGKLISWTSLGSATLRSWIPKALAMAQVIVVLIAVRQWAYVTTYRLYLEAGTTSPTSAAAQRFDVEGHRVVPRIVTRGPDRVAYTTDVSTDSTIQVGLRPTRPTRYAIEWRDSSTHRVLAQGSADQPTSIACASPRGRGAIELVSDQPVAWVDPRIVQDGKTGWYAAALATLLLSSVAWAGWRRDSEARDSTRIFWFKVLAVTVGTAVPAIGLRDGAQAHGRRGAQRHPGTTPRPGRGDARCAMGVHTALWPPPAPKRKQVERMAVRRHRAAGIRAAPRSATEPCIGFGFRPMRKAFETPRHATVSRSPPSVIPLPTR